MSVGGCWYFLEKCWKTGWSEQDVRDRRTLPWMATGAVPVRIRTAISLFVENSHLETRHQGMMFRSPRAFVGSTATPRYEPCTQFINVSQKALHIYFIDGCRRIKSKTETATCEQAPRSLFLFWLCMARNFQVSLSQIPPKRWIPYKKNSKSGIFVRNFFILHAQRK